MRYALTDAEWRLIEPILPRKPRGVPRVNDRRVLNGIFWVLKSGGRGETCLSRTAPTQPATIASCGGDVPVSGIASWQPSRIGKMLRFK